MIKLVEMKTRDIAVCDIAKPVDLNTAQYGFHRTSPWLFVERYSYRIVNSPYFDPNVVRTVEATSGQPIYAAEGTRHNGLPVWCILRPCHPKKQLRQLYIDREGGEQ